MKTTIKTLLASALAIACASGVYAQTGGAAGSGSGGGGGTNAGAVGGPGYGASPGGGSLNSPSTQRQYRNSSDTGGYGNSGNTGMGAGTRGRDTSTMQPGDNTSPSNSNATPPQDEPSYQRHQ